MRNNEKFVVLLFYKFFKVEDPKVLREEQYDLASKIGLKGRMLIAEEGVNATFEGTESQVKEYMDALHSDAHFKDLVFKQSEGTGLAFTKLSIKVRKEVVTLGQSDFDVQNETAKELTADDFQQMYEKNEDFAVLDLRNDYEIQVGYFDKTVNPKLDNFRDPPEKLPELEDLKNKKVVAVCTGGIRCEKATCLLNRVGFKDLYQLKDGIHTYMQKYPGKHFKGTLFVFDNRMTTPIINDPKREVVGRCFSCQKVCEDIWSDDSTRPSKKVVCCAECAHKHAHLRSTAPHGE